MGIQCVSTDAALRPPTTIDFSTGQPSSPFVLKGSPMTNKPNSIPNASEYRRTAKALENIKAPKYLNDENYYILNLATENIIGPDSFGNTTLRYESRNYTLAFIAIHAGLWSSSEQQVSMVFTSDTFEIFHICIPIITDTEEENPFLKAWLSPNDRIPLPSGFTVNELLNFKTPQVNFATLQYCLQYNEKRTISPYTLCLFETPLKVSALSSPAWLQTLSVPSKIPAEGDPTPYRRKTFDEIFNLMFHGQVMYYIRDFIEPKLISLEKHIYADVTQDVIKPVTYSVKLIEVYKKPIKEGFASGANDSLLSLQNVKCYPINLATQIDANGNVVIDQETKKPVDLKAVSGNQVAAANIGVGDTNAAAETQAYIQFMIIFSIIFLIVLAAIIAVCVYVFRGKSISTDTQTNAALGATAASVASSVASSRRSSANASAAGTGLVP